MAYYDMGASAGGLAATRWGHAGPYTLIGAILASILLVLRPLPPGSAASLVVPSALFLLVVASWLAMRQHDRRLCELCMASMPLNPSESAVRLRRRLALTHLSTDRRVLIAYIVVLLGSNVALLDGPLAFGGAGRFVWAGVQATMIYVVICHATHRRLQPWCAQCGGGGSDHAESLDPLPAGSGER